MNTANLIKFPVVLGIHNWRDRQYYYSLNNWKQLLQYCKKPLDGSILIEDVTNYVGGKQVYLVSEFSTNGFTEINKFKTLIIGTAYELFKFKELQQEFNSLVKQGNIYFPPYITDFTENETHQSFFRNNKMEYDTSPVACHKEVDLIKETKVCYTYAYYLVGLKNL